MTSSNSRHIGGFTLTETVATLLIVVLVTTVLATGVPFAFNQYTKSVTLSESKTLYSTIATTMQAELRSVSDNPAPIFAAESDAYGYHQLLRLRVSYASKGNAEGEEKLSSIVQITGTNTQTSDFGRIAFYNEKTDAYYEPIAKMAYARDLGAEISVSGKGYTKDENEYIDSFHVTLKIADANGKLQTQGTFDVEPLDREIEFKTGS